MTLAVHDQAFPSPRHGEKVAERSEVGLRGLPSLEHGPTTPSPQPSPCPAGRGGRIALLRSACWLLLPGTGEKVAERSEVGLRGLPSREHGRTTLTPALSRPAGEGAGRWRSTIRLLSPLGRGWVRGGLGHGHHSYPHPSPLPPCGRGSRTMAKHDQAPLPSGERLGEGRAGAQPPGHPHLRCALRLAGRSRSAGSPQAARKPRSG